MDVFDSNVWLSALLTDAPEPSRLLTETIEGNRDVAVDAYIHEEVIENIERSPRPRDLRDEAQATFSSTIADLDNVQFPTYREIGTTDPERVRSSPAVLLLRDVLEIQAKDVPVVVFAADLLRADIADSVTVYTIDSDLAELRPGEHGITGVEMHKVAL